jgi:Protein of unknown function (DUF2975)
LFINILHIEEQSMSTLKSDPLLAAARFALIAIGGILLFAIAMLVLGTGAALTVERADVLAQVAAVDAPPSVYWLVLAAMLVIIAILAAALQFIRLLYRMVRSVDAGDPFAPVNAERLAQMGWLTVGVQLGAVAVWSMAQIVKSYAPDHDFSWDLSLSGWLLALVLFILARVFRHGTDLRAEVEGTV